MNTIRQWMAWTERRLAILMISEGLEVGLAEVIQGPLTITFRLRLLAPSRAGLARILSLGPAIGQALQTGRVRVSSSARGILLEVPSPLPRTPSAELLARSSRGLSIAVGLDSLRRPVCLDFRRWPHLLILGPTGRGKSQALRSILFSIGANNPPMRALFLIIAKKAEDWRAFQRAASCFGLLIQPGEQEAALSWLSEELQARAERGAKWPQLFLAVDDLANVMATAKLAGELGEIASLGRAAGVHLLLSSQTSGKAGGLTQDTEQNMTARLIFGAADATAGARYAGAGGHQVQAIGQAPGDALLLLDGQAQRLAAGLCLDTSIALLPEGGLPKPWESRTIQEYPEQEEQARTGQLLSNGRPASEDQEAGSEQASQNRLDPSRPPTPEEQELIRQLYQETGSKRQAILRAYGHYNGKVFGYVSQALEQEDQDE